MSSYKIILQRLREGELGERDRRVIAKAEYIIEAKKFQDRYDKIKPIKRPYFKQIWKM